ncbi:MAG: EamA/RhaT family transporter [Rhodospirillales bacterium]|nr:EamA/RhaT family transporter [Rhodospirillales bacterium]
MSPPASGEKALPAESAGVSPDAAFYVRGLILAVSAGLVWSTLGLGIRFLEEATAWQIVFYRSLGLFVAVLVAMAVRHRGRIDRSFRAARWNNLLGGIAQAVGATASIFAILHTTVANVVFMLCSAPFFAAFLAWLVLGERVPLHTWIAMATALIGVGLMVGDGFASGAVFGNLIALLIPVSFATFAVTLRYSRTADKFPTLAFNALFSMALAVLFIPGFGITPWDFLLCFGLGILQKGVGAILFTLGARYLRAAEVTLVSLIEVVLGPVWVWLAIGETPSTLALAGGAVVITAVLGQAYVGARAKRNETG